MTMAVKLRFVNRLIRSVLEVIPKHSRICPKRRRCFSRKIWQFSPESRLKICCCSSIVNTAIPFFSITAVMKEFPDPLPPARARIVHQLPRVFKDPRLLQVQGLNDQILLGRKEGIKKCA